VSSNPEPAAARTSGSFNQCHIASFEWFSTLLHSSKAMAAPPKG